MGAIACDTDAVPLASPTSPSSAPTPTLTSVERENIRSAFKAAFDRTDLGSQHQVQWLPHPGEEPALMWVVPPAGGRFRAIDCQQHPNVPAGVKCIQGLIENTTEYPMNDTMASCAYKDGSTPGLRLVGTVKPGEIGTWEWPYTNVLSGRYLCRLAWFIAKRTYAACCDAKGVINDN